MGWSILYLFFIHKSFSTIMEGEMMNEKWSILLSQMSSLTFAVLFISIIMVILAGCGPCTTWGTRVTSYL